MNFWLVMMLMLQSGTQWVTYQYSIQPCPTALGTGLELLQIPAGGEATEAGSMSSTSGCGAMGGGSLAGSLWKKLSRGIERDLLKPAKQSRRWSGNENSTAPEGLLGTMMQWEMNEEKMLWYIVYTMVYTCIYISFNIP
jgi:hypothetical protein